MALDLRTLRYFVAVAEELHFRAPRSGCTSRQPALSELIPPARGRSARGVA